MDRRQAVRAASGPKSFENIQKLPGDNGKELPGLQKTFECFESLHANESLEKIVKGSSLLFLLPLQCRLCDAFRIRGKSVALYKFQFKIQYVKYLAPRIDNRKK